MGMMLTWIIIYTPVLNLEAWFVQRKPACTEIHEHPSALGYDFSRLNVATKVAKHFIIYTKTVMYCHEVTIWLSVEFEEKQFNSLQPHRT